MDRSGSTVHPDLFLPAGLIADRTRAAMLLALETSTVLSAKDLARAAGVTPATASEHLARLAEGGLVLVERRSRMSFYRLAGPAVVTALRALAALARTNGDSALRPRADAPDHIARTCYDHLAGRLGVALLDCLVRRRFVSGGGGGDYRVTVLGAKYLRDFGLDLRQSGPHRRPPVRPCLDRTERRPHLAGHVGAQLAARCFELRWLERIPDTRALHVTPLGRRGFRAQFGVDA
jgi:DNA-binding transcriptional ArsR family regulator